MGEQYETNKLTDILSNGEYEAQLFETSSFCLVHEIKELVLSDLQSVTNQMQRSLFAKCQNPDEGRKLENLMKNLRNKFETAIEKHMKEMEVKVSAIFNIPSHILLPEDKVQEKQYSKTDVKKVDEEIELLKSQYRRAICMESLLKKEKKTCFNLDLVEKKMLEMEDNASSLTDIFGHNKRSLDTIIDQFQDLTSLKT